MACDDNKVRDYETMALALRSEYMTSRFRSDAIVYAPDNINISQQADKHDSIL